MKRSCILFLLLFSNTLGATTSPSEESVKNVSPASLTATPPKSIHDIKPYQRQISGQGDFFFGHLPQAKLPKAIEQEIDRVFSPLLKLLSPISKNQTQQQRSAQVMKQIKHFYGVLYMLAEEEAIRKEAATKGHGKSTTLSDAAASEKAPTLNRTLTLQELKESTTWQDYLKIRTASSYNEELVLLGKVFKHELSMFDYLPQFETAYYQNVFVNLRHSSELTRMYLILVNRLRMRFLSDVNRSTNAQSDGWGVVLEERDQVLEQLKTASPSQRNQLNKRVMELSNQLFHEISAFKESPFYQFAMAFQNLDWSKTYPITFSDPQGNPTTLEDVIKKGYDFLEYFAVDQKTGKVEVNALYSLMFKVIPSKNDPKKDSLAFTALGNLLFSGNISYKKVPVGHKKYLFRGTFDPQPSTKKVKGKTVNGPPLIDLLFITDHKEQVVNKVKISVPHRTPTLGYLELLCFSSIRFLHNNTSELFEANNLKLTFEKMVSTDLPNFIDRKPEDYLIIKDINNLQKFFTQQAPSPNESVQPQGFFSSCCHFFSSAASDIYGGFKSLADEVKHETDELSDEIAEGSMAAWGEFKKLGEKAYNTVKTDAEADWSNLKSDALTLETYGKNLGYTMLHGLKSFGYSVVAAYYASCIGPMLFQHETAAEAMQNAEKWQKKATTQMNDTTKGLMQVVNEVATAADSAVDSTVGAILNNTIGTIDPQIAHDIGGCIDAAVGGVVNFIKDGVDQIILLGCDAIKLTEEGFQLAESVISSIVVSSLASMVTGKPQGLFTKQGADAMGEEFENFAESVCSSTLEYLSFTLTCFTSALESAMLCIAYFIETLTEAVIQVCAVAADLFYYGWKDGGNFEEGYNQAYKKINAHRRLIAGLVTMVVIVAATVATGGLDSPLMMGMMVMTMGMMTMGLVGDYQADAAAIKKAARQKAFVNAFKEYVVNNAKVIEAFQTEAAIEELVQLHTQAMNQERALLYYQNYLNSLFNDGLSSRAYGNGIYIHELINQKQTPNGPMPSIMEADLGSLYGIETGRLSIAPSGGFPIYSKARGTYSQEAALEPTLIPSQSPTNILSKSPKIKTFWFHQKDLSNIPTTDSIKADVLWRSIYEMDSPFYIGVYLTERSFDTAAMNKLYAEFDTVITPSTGETSSASFDEIYTKIDTFNRYLMDYDHLAKMFVCYRTQGPPSEGKKLTAAATPRLGVYVHEAPATTTPANTEGWMKNSFPSINFKRGTWYRMQASLDKGKLTTSFWEVGTDEDAQNAQPNENPPAHATTKTITVPEASVPSEVTTITGGNKFAGSMGVITSGASVEYIVLEPTKVALAPVPAKGEKEKVVTLARPTQGLARNIADKDLTQTPGLKVTEAERELDWKRMVAEEFNPKFGKYNLKAASQEAVMQSEFVYTANTFSEKELDYLVFANGISNPATSVVGFNPAGKIKADALMSLVSGEIYNKEGKLEGRVKDAIKLYEKQNPSLSGKIKTDIKASQKVFWSAMTGPFTFKNLSLKGDLNAMLNGAFIYTGPSLNGKYKEDYYVTATKGEVGMSKTGMPFVWDDPDSSINRLISLITGEVYSISLNGKTPTIISKTNIRSIDIADANNTYKVYKTYKHALTKQQQATIETAQKAAAMAAESKSLEEKIEKRAQSALNTITTLESTLSTDITFAYGKYEKALKAAQTTGKKVAATLKKDLADYQHAVTQNKAGATSVAYTTLNNTITKVNAAIKAGNTAVTNYTNAPPQPAPTSDGSDSGYGSSSNSTYGSSSSQGNYNSTYGSYNPSGPGGGGYGSGGGYGGSSGGYGGGGY